MRANQKPFHSRVDGQSSYEFFRQFLTSEKSDLDTPPMILLAACQQIPALC